MSSVVKLADEAGGGAGAEQGIDHRVHPQRIQAGTE